MTASPHTFHIPVLGVGYSVDAPLKVARFGISSVMSLVDDALLDKLRGTWLEKANLPYEPIPDNTPDARAKRTTEYLNTVQRLIDLQMEVLRSETFVPGSDIYTYFELLPDSSPLKAEFQAMLDEQDAAKKQEMQKNLRAQITPGAIEVNIMTKVDKTNYDENRQPMEAKYNDAHASLRGFAESELESGIVFSAGMNPRLYSYLATLDDFFPGEDGRRKKEVILKVSDYRSALIQGKFLAKKGIWVSEFRIESGLNCGGHAFATDGYLLGPILEEFVKQREALVEEMRTLYLAALGAKSMEVHESELGVKITVQGGVGTNSEHEFLRRRYGVASVGWGSPFLLVPEVMNIDDDTLGKLSAAGEDELYLSDASPLGVPFNNLRNTSKEIEKNERIADGKPGSKCLKMYLKLNTELTEKPICTASINFLKKKKTQLEDMNLNGSFQKTYDKALEKECLCEGLITSVLNVNNLSFPNISKAVSVCPGPNLAYYSKITTLRDMVSHIYGRLNLVTDPSRPNMFIKELHLYIDYLQRAMDGSLKSAGNKTAAYFKSFAENIRTGIEYYRELIPEIKEESETVLQRMRDELEMLERKLMGLNLEPIPA
ncbi:MAG: hypothetical protein CL946_13595 [Ectothiorhodospiraceae bacterium]|nr:hypothetical protein [Ectothiorhodospiraceae bacterium]